MTQTSPPQPGTIAWVDLTVPGAPGLRDFYSTVTGWVPQALSMGAYDDYVMNASSTGQATAGPATRRGGASILVGRT